MQENLMEPAVNMIGSLEDARIRMLFNLLHMLT